MRPVAGPRAPPAAGSPISPPSSAAPRPSASCDAAPRKGSPAGARHRPSVRRRSRRGHSAGWPAVAAHVATGRADAAKHGHAPGAALGRHPRPL